MFLCYDTMDPITYAEWRYAGCPVNIMHHDIHHNDTKHDDTQYKDTKRDDTWYKDT